MTRVQVPTGIFGGIVSLTATALADGQDVALAAVDGGGPPLSGNSITSRGGVVAFHFAAVASVVATTNPSPAAIAVRVAGTEKGRIHASRFSTNAAHTVGLCGTVTVRAPKGSTITLRNVSGSALTLEPGAICGIARIL